MRKLLVALLAFGLMGMLLAPLASAFAGDSAPTPADTCSVSDSVKTKYTNTCGGCAGGAYDPSTSYAVDVSCSPVCCVLTLVDNIGTWFFWIVMILAFIMLLWGAVQFMTAGGSEEKTGAARQTLIYALIGVAVAWLSRFLIQMVKGMIAG